MKNPYQERQEEIAMRTRFIIAFCVIMAVSLGCYGLWELLV